ncbi:MAG: DUF7033 domain-containing protein [Chitinophagaceae bacterium]
MLLIYAPVISERLKYITATLFQSVGFTQWQLSNNKTEVENFTGNCIVYDTIPINNHYHIYPHTLLFEKNIQAQAIVCTKWDDLPVLFPVNKGNLPFDILAASFYLLSRYEEYSSPEKDAYGRFPYHESIAYKENFLSIPLINYWLNKWFQHHFWQNLLPNFKATVFSCIPTYDVDIAFKYAHQSILKNFKQGLKNSVTGNFSAIKQQLLALKNGDNDVFNCFAEILTQNKQYGLNPLFFILSANKQTSIDKQVSISKKGMQLLIKKLAAKSTIGIHPSSESNHSKEALENEINNLFNINELPIQYSRQHYLILNWPNTYKQLIDLGINRDYSMGYSGKNGFRASFAKPFHWFNLAKNEVTPLIIYPFAYMDANAIYYEKQQPHEALQELIGLYEKVKGVNGVFIPIFHNHFMGYESEGTPWRTLHHEFLKYASQ